MNSQRKILVIGKIPPPIGGVTIHVKRLIEHFNREGNNQIVFLDINNTSKIQFLICILKYRFIHLHTSNVYYRFIFSLFCFLSFKKLLITIHGNLGRYKLNKNIFDYFTLLLCFIPIVINEKSYYISKKINKKSLLISSFFPPLSTIPLNNDLLNHINLLKKKYSLIFCTNAYNLTRDTNGDEIYGISQLVNIFTKVINKALIISDPSGAYYKYFKKNKIIIPKNVTIIPYKHDFFEVLKEANVFIRNTTTDGDSLSVKEALFLNKTVFATDVVDRPYGCALYTKQDSLYLQKIISEAFPHKKEKIPVESCYLKLANLYTKLLK